MVRFRDTRMVLFMQVCAVGTIAALIPIQAFDASTHGVSTFQAIAFGITGPFWLANIWSAARYGWVGTYVEESAVRLVGPFRTRRVPRDQVLDVVVKPGRFGSRLYLATRDGNTTPIEGVYPNSPHKAELLAAQIRTAIS